MECFKYMKDIYFESFDQFIKDVDRAREDMVETDLRISQIPYIIDTKAIEELPDGRWNMWYEDVEFECFFQRKESDVLYVFLNGAITGEDSSLPMFGRWTYYKFMDGSILNISDPMYRIYDKLKLGWYYGNKETNLQKILADFVLNIAGIIGVKQSNIIFFGSSGGGYASIACASYIPDAKSIAINPQIILQEYGYSREYTEVTGIRLSGKDKWHRNNLIYFLQKRKHNRYLLFVNLRCKSDMQQVKNICSALDIKVKYGLNIFDNLIIWLYDADVMPWIDAHCVQENYILCFLFEFLIRHCDNLQEINLYDSWFRLVNEFYYEEKRIEKYWHGKMPDIGTLEQLKHMNRKIVIFGLGGYADLLNRELFHIEQQNYYHIQYVIDNDEDRKGMYYGLEIKHPSEIRNWKELYVVITSKRYHLQIRHQLETMGLEYRKDFILYKDLYQ